MGSGFSKMKKQRKMLEEQFRKMQEELEKSEYVGSSGSGLVEVTLKGDKSIKSIKIKPECVDPEDVEGLEDLVVAAFNDAASKIQDSAGTGGIPPGLGGLGL